MLALNKQRGRTLGIDGATNVISKSMSNIIVHTRPPLFIEYLKADRKRETTASVVSKFKEVISRREGQFGFHCYISSVSVSCNGMSHV